GLRFTSPSRGADSGNIAVTQSLVENLAAPHETTVLRTDTTATWTFGTVDANCPSDTFQLNPTSGTVSMVTFTTLKALDYETKTSYSCEVVATDTSGTLSITATVTLSVDNVYDVAPIFTGGSTVVKANCVEEASAGSQCSMSSNILFVDSEVDASGDRLTCSVKGDGSEYFSVSASGKTCVFSVGSKIDRDKLSSDAFPSLLVMATDLGGNVGTASVSASILDINDNTPVCTSSRFNKRITENVESSGFTIANIGSACSDIDKGANATLQFEFTSSSTGYSVGLTSGVVTLAGARDYDTLSANPEILQVRVRDNDTSGPLSTTVTVTVTVMSQNDNRPTISSVTPASGIATVSENDTVGTVLFTLTGSDADKASEPDSNIVWSLVSATSNSSANVLESFSIDSTTGALKVGTKPMDFESWQYADVVVKCSDLGSPAQSVTRSLTVVLTDVNEMAPVFSPSYYYKTSIAENSIMNTTVLSPFTVTDPDRNSLPVLCEITSGNTDSVFRFRPTDRSVIELAKTIEPDASTNHPTIFLLQIICKDNNGTSPYLASTATVEVNIRLSNDFDPVVTGSCVCTSSARLSESTTTPGTTVGSVGVTDNDVGTDGIVDCSIKSPTGPFEVQSCSKIILTGPLDYETANSYDLVVMATDRGSPKRTGSTTVTIFVGDVDDNAPYCVTYLYSWSVPENTAVGTSVGSVNCKDADSAGVTYSIVSAGVPFKVTTTGEIQGNGGKLLYVLSEAETRKQLHRNFRFYLFTAAPSRVILRTTGATAIDYETTTSYEFTVRTTDRGTFSRTADATVRIAVTPVNEMTPTFANTSISVAESTAVGTKLASFTATDTDTGGHGVQSYSIKSVTISGGGLFGIDGSGGILLLRQLDYESIAATPKQYVLTTLAVDGGSLTGVGQLVILVTDVNDNKPVFGSRAYNLELSESAATNTVATGTQPTATDADSSALYGKIKYSISAGNTGSFLQIDSASGSISRSSTPGLNYESLTPPGTYYNLTILAVDENGAGPNTASCYVKVNILDAEEGAPAFIPSVATTSPVLESAPVGTLVYSPTVSHVDKWDLPVFSISPADGNFSIDPATGKGARAKLRPDNSGVAPLPIPLTSGDHEQLMLRHHAREIRSRSPYRKYMIWIIAHPPGGGRLAGRLLKPNCTVPAAPDYETATSHTLKVVATDKNSRIGTLTLTVPVTNVNEFMASCSTPGSTTTVFLDENDQTSPSFPKDVLAFVCTDADAGTSLKLSVSKVDGAAASTPYDFLGSTLRTNAAINYESYSLRYYNVLEITVSDQGPDTANILTVTLTISVNPVNEFPPVITASSLTTTVSEDLVVGAQVVAPDSDTGLNHGTVRFALLAGNDKGYFTLNEATGSLRSVRNLDREDSATYLLTVNATDGPGRSATATMTVSLTDVNDNLPSFTQATYSVSVVETASDGATIFSFAGLVTDADATSPNNAVSLSLSTTGVPIKMVGDSLQVSGTSPLKASTTPSYILTVMAADGGSPSRSTVCRVLVKVLEVNTAPPTFYGTASISIAENTAVGTRLLTVNATDLDSGSGGLVTFSLVSGNTDSAFSIGPTDGIVTIANVLDCDFGPRKYLLGVEARDSGTPVKSATWTLTVSVLDVNDNSPTWNSSNTYTRKYVICAMINGLSKPKHTIWSLTPPTKMLVTVSEALSGGLPQTVYTPAVFDPDSGANGSVTFSLVSLTGTAPDGTSPAFSVSAATGAIVAEKMPDREFLETYYLLEKACDGGTPSLCSSKLFTIVISDANDNTPSFGVCPKEATVYENSPTNTLVATLPASDRDKDANAQISLYSLVTADGGASSAGGKFTVDSNGNIKTSASLDREAKGVYQFYLTAVDNGSPSKNTGSCLLNITILDRNDNAPVFGGLPITAWVSEDAPGGTVFHTLSVTDADIGINAELEFSIVHFTPANSFTMSNAGQLSLFSGGLLDRETHPSYNITVLVADRGTADGVQTATTTVSINIGDVNDNTPTFGSVPVSRSVPENSVVDFNVGAPVLASDPDSGENASLTYKIDAVLVPTSGGDYFKIHPTSGQIQVKVGSLDREAWDTYQLRLLAIDNGIALKRTGTGTVTIIITDVNDNPPVFTATYDTGISVTENSPAGTKVVTFTTTDRDIGDNAVALYRIDSTRLNGSLAASYFQLNATSGILTVKTPIDRETYASLEFYVIAEDKGSPVQTASTRAVVTVNDVNDNAPTFAKTFISTEMAY
uniref:Protocadherin Fat 4 n=1 Tax=Macrostomum lignano TaxID=282301 RepID=A0A1I8H1R9_9PLAT